MIDERAIWHEAGHPVVALNLGLRAADIWYKNGNFECTHAQCSGQHICIVLAAGAASEKLRFNGYSTKGSSADAERIIELGGSIDEYLPEALELLAAYRRELELMAEELGKNWCQSAFSGRPNPFKLMSTEEIEGIHKKLSVGGNGIPL
jgi:hypothetical protein